jgi:hypothetical protein
VIGRYTRFVIVVGALVVAALVGLGVAWRGLAATEVVSDQVAYAVSGVLGGVALLGFALGVGSIQTTRRAEARERAALDRVVVAAADLLAVVREPSS